MACPLNTKFAPNRKQRGAALMVMLVIMVMGAATILVSSLSSSGLRIERDKITADALAQAKDALIGYAVKVQIDNSDCTAFGNNCRRPGDLLCPDTDNDGDAESNCGNASGTTWQDKRLGRLPWKTLGLPDLRDGNGERLWYAVSNNFKNSTRTTCTAPGQAGCLNSDTAGTITIRSPDGNILDDGSTMSGAVAIIIAPGDALTRQDNVTQTRGCTLGVDCDAIDKCTATPATSVPKCNPVNYLDNITSIEDNASFMDGSATDGFIQGSIKDSSHNIILNDQLLVITQDNIMYAIQKRVAAEVKQCLNEYALNSQNMGHYPWAATLNPNNYSDASNQLFGRVPDTQFTRTKQDSNPNMNDIWSGTCNINSSSGWWLNWKEMVFYGLANAYKPLDPLNPPAANACVTAGACMSVNPPSATADKKFVVIVAGKKLAGQSRDSNVEKSTLSNYLEAPNSAGASPFAQSAPTATFNDTVAFP